jgi:hypothetical protein
MKTLITLLVCLATVSCFAQETKTELKKENTSLFNKNELSLTLGSSVELKNDYDVNFAAGLSYFITRNIGIEASVPFYNTGGTTFERVNFGLNFRAPIARFFAPFVHGGSSWDFKNDEFDYYVGLGNEFKLNKKWSVLVLTDYKFKKFDNEGAWQPGVGLRLTF